MEYFVIDHHGNPTFDVDADAAESFATFKKASHRAKKLAHVFPGETVVIAHAVAYVTCDVKEPEVRVKRVG